jgi:hypothetical protein
MSVATVATGPITEPARHALMASDCECGLCAPTWARRRGKSKRFTEPVTLVEALEAEELACRPGMVERHRQCLSAMVGATDELVDEMPPDDLGEPGVGLAVLLFAAELASAVRPEEFRTELPGGLVSACEQTVTAAALAATGCLVGLVTATQTLSGLVGASR